MVTPSIDFCNQNDKKMINTINIFLTVFGECDILTENYEKLMPTKVIRLNWEILPQGNIHGKRSKKI